MAATFETPGAEGNGTGNVTLGDPSAGSVAGDIWMAVVHASDQNAMSMSGDWTEILQGNGGGTASRLAAFWHRYTGSAPSLVVTHTDAAATIVGGIAVIRGAKASGSPVNVAGSAVDGGTGTAVTASAITTTVDGCLILRAGGTSGAAGVTWSNPTGIPTTVGWTDGASPTRNAYLATNGTPQGTCSLWYGTDTTAGDTGTAGSTLSASRDWAIFLIAIEPAADAPAGSPRRLHIHGVPLTADV